MDVLEEAKSGSRKVLFTDAIRSNNMRVANELAEFEKIQLSHSLYDVSSSCCVWHSDQIEQIAEEKANIKHKL